MIPDAVFAIGEQTFAAEFDRGLETLRYFVRTKVGGYRHVLEGFPLNAVLIMTDRQTRMEALAKALARENMRFLYTTIDQVRAYGLAAPVFFEHPDGKGKPLI